MLSICVQVAPVVPVVRHSSSPFRPIVRSLQMPAWMKKVGVPGEPVVSATRTAHAVAGAPGICVQVTVAAVMSVV